MGYDLHLKDYEDGYRFEGRCRCGHERRYSWADLRALPGVHDRSYIAADVQPRIRCTACRNHAVRLQVIRDQGKRHHWVGGMP